MTTAQLERCGVCKKDRVLWEDIWFCVRCDAGASHQPPRTCLINYMRWLNEDNE